MNDALVIMNPRQIEVTAAAFAELPITKIYLKNWSEGRIEDVAWQVAAGLGYEWYWVASDDIIVRPEALAAVRGLCLSAPFVTGYSQRSHTDWTVNLCEKPLQGDHPHPEAYEFMEFKDVVSRREHGFHTTFAGMSLTGASRETWQKFPFQCFRDSPDDGGYASDFNLSMRLRDSKVPITAAREAFCYHWRHEWVNTSDPRDADPVLGGEEIVVTQ